MRDKERETKRKNTVWAYPHLFVREAVCALAVLCGLVIGGLVLDAPLGRPANPDVTPNPARAPWFFLGYQELLRHLPVELAGASLLVLSLVGLAAAPYLLRRLGQRGRHLAAVLFVLGFVAWYGLIIVTRVCRGSFWAWQCPGPGG